MNKFFNVKNKLLAIVTLVAMILAITVTRVDIAKAAETVKINVVSATAEVGAEVSVKVEIISDAILVGGEIYINFDSSILQYVSSGSGVYSGGSTIKLNNAGETSYTIKFKALKAGTSNITVDKNNTVMAAGMDIDSNVTVSNGSVKVTAPVTYSSENRLASLSISPGVLSPSFSAGTTSYTTSVGEDVTKLVVSAKPKDDKATVSVSGTSLSIGTNTVTITVKAENGSKKVYKITVTRAGEVATEAPTEAPVETKVKVNEKEYVIVGDFESHPLPEGFEAFEYDLDGTKVQAAKGTNNKLIIMYLDSSEQDSVPGFYVYDSVTKTYTLYNEISQPGTKYIILPITDTMEKPFDWEKTMISINEISTEVLMHEGKRYCIFYAVNSSGASGWYLYDTVDTTVMSADVIRLIDKSEEVSVDTDKTTDDSKSGIDDNVWIIVVSILSVVAAASIIAAVMSALNAKKCKKAFSSVVNDKDFGERISDDYEEDGDDELEYDEEELEDVLAEDEPEEAEAASYEEALPDEDVLTIDDEEASSDEEVLAIDDEEASSDEEVLAIDDEETEDELELLELDDEE